MKKILFTSIMMQFCLVIFAQIFWSNIALENVQVTPQIQARNANYQHLDITAFTTILFQAPLKISKTQLSDVRVNLPMPNGSIEEFMVFEAPIMEEALQQKYPNIRTFIFQSMENLSSYGRADITPKGFHLQLSTLNGSSFIDPISQLSNEDYIIYDKKDFYTNKDLPSCLSQETSTNENSEMNDNTVINEKIEFQAKTTKLANGSQLRTYRIAVSATAAYTQFHGGTVTDGLSAIVTTINRVNAVYERDFSIRLILVGDNDEVIFTDTNSDPFYNSNTNAYYDAGDKLNINRITLNSEIGENNYDIGHVVGRSGSGLAGFGVVCRTNGNSHKANGTTGISNPIGDPFDIDYVAHEIGHQFRASHTFNGSSGSCATNISTNSAYEPGSGSTIMAYAGICAPQNTQNNSDDYFHNRSFNQVVNFTQGNGDACAVKTTTGNSIPVLDIVTPNNLTIPISTPFYLEAQASDIDGDVLTYCWEQYDLGPQGSPSAPSGNAPLFRSFSPVISPIRTFPQLSDILDNTSTYGEILPDYQRSMNFKVTVRDNVAGAGAVIDEEVSIDVASNAGPFLVTNPNTSLTWTAGDNETITWDVANTDNAPVNCATVDIVLSTNGGQTYPIILASAVPNSGSFNISVPFALTDQARIKIQCATNIFFDISNQDFDIVADCASVDASITVTEQIGNVTFCLNSSGELSVSATSPTLAITTYEWFHNNVAIPNSNTSTLTLTNTDAGEYYCSISNGCNTVLSNVEVITVVSNLIIPVITEISPGVLESSLGSGNQWYLNGNLILGENGQRIFISEEGTYTVSSVAGSCSASSNAISTAVKDFSAITSILIHPNPSNGSFNIEVANWDKDITVEVKDVLGKTILSKSSFQKQTNLDLTSFSNGMYLVRLSSESYSSTYKILKK